MKTTFKAILLIVLLLFTVSVRLTLAQSASDNIRKPVILTDAQDKYPLGLYLEILEDPAGELTIEDVTSPEYAARFVPSREEKPTFGFTDSAIWVRFRVRNETAQTSEWRLEHGYTNTHHVDLYIPRLNGQSPSPRSENRFQVIKTGILRPFDSRDIDYHRLVFRLPIPPGTGQSVYLRIRTESSLPVPLTLWHPETFAQQSRTKMLTEGLFIGMLLIMASYNLFIWLFLREKAYLHYVLFVSAMILMELSLRGLAAQYFWPDQPWLNRYAVLVGVIGINIFALKFAATFLETKRRVPNQHKVITLLSVLWGLTLIQSLFFGYSLVCRQIICLTVISFLFLIIVGFTTWRKGYRAARYYLITWTIFLITTIVQALALFGFFSSFILVRQSFPVGIIALLLFLSLALADRISIFRQEREAARAAALKASHEKERLVREQNIVLEQQVAERLLELSERNQQLRQEIAEREKAQQNFLLLEMAVKQSGEGIAIANMDGYNQFINRAWAQMHGYNSEEELLGTHLSIFHTEDQYQEEVRRFIEQVIKSGHHEGEDTHIKKDGTVFHTWMAANVVRDEGGDPIAIVGACRDITDQRQAREMLKQAKEQAEEARHIAEKANQAKSTFLANMSHELRTPLNAILGFAQIMARSRISDPKQRENLAIIRRSGEHLLTLINQVLDFSKIEAGHLTLDERDLDLYYMLSELEDMFRILADNKKLRLLFSRDEDVPQHIRTDEVRLRQVLINLLNNALKFTKEGGVAVRVGVADSAGCESDFRKLKFEIEDTGPGISPDETDGLFEAFVQAETGEQIQEVTGLGLAISKRFVQLMGGDITVRSPPGYGTIFAFEIQAGVADATETETLPATRRAVALDSVQSCYRILIADDNPDNRNVLFRLLGPFGFDLRGACNGHEAVEIWKKWKPHLIWMDIRMPVTDGYEAAKRIRNEESERDTVIIALSASAYEEERTVALSEGCDDFLRKPFREADLFDLMSKYLDVRFVYEDEHEAGHMQRKAESRKILTPEALSVLPHDVLDQFRKAAEIADLGMAMRLTEQIRAEDKVLADALAELVENFRFDTLQKLFKKEK